MTNIYNLFKFLKDKEGREIPSEFKLKLTYSPEELTPEDLKVDGNLYLHGSSIETLPSGLDVQKNLDLSSSKIKKLPADLKVGGQLDITKTELKPESIPPALQSKVKWYSGNFEDFKNYNTLDAIKIPGIKKEEKGKPLEFTTTQDLITQLDSRGTKDTNNPSKNFPEIVKFIEQQPVNNIKAYIVYIPSYYPAVEIQAVLSITLPNIPDPIIIKFNLDNSYKSTIKYKSKELKLNGFNSDLKAQGLEVALGRVVPGFNKQVVPKHLQDEKGKTLRISQVIQRQGKPVSMNLGKLQRGGDGVEGEYKDYAPSFSSEVQNYLSNLANKLGVVWRDFVAYDNGGTVNFVVKGVGEKGKTVYLNRQGSGMGVTYRLYDSEFKKIAGS